MQDDVRLEELKQLGLVLLNDFIYERHLQSVRILT